MPIVLKSGNLNLLEPSGPVQACNGIALPLPFRDNLYVRPDFFCTATFVFYSKQFLGRRMWMWFACTCSVTRVYLGVQNDATGLDSVLKLSEI